MFIWRRRTIGMMIADLGLHSNRTHAPLRRGAAVRRAAATTFVETGLVAIALALMVVGQFMVGLGLWGVAVIAFWPTRSPRSARAGARSSTGWSARLSCAADSTRLPLRPSPALR